MICPFLESDAIFSIYTFANTHHTHTIHTHTTHTHHTHTTHTHNTHTQHTHNTHTHTTHTQHTHTTHNTHSHNTYTTHTQHIHNTHAHTRTHTHTQERERERERWCSKYILYSQSVNKAHNFPALRYCHRFFGVFQIQMRFETFFDLLHYAFLKPNFA